MPSSDPQVHPRELLPSRRHLDHLLTGARHHRLHPHYIEYLEHHRCYTVNLPLKIIIILFTLILLLLLFVPLILIALFYRISCQAESMRRAFQLAFSTVSRIIWACSTCCASCVEDSSHEIYRSTGDGSTSGDVDGDS